MGIKKKPRTVQVNRIKFSSDKRGNPVRIGGFREGDVYIGKLRFKGKKWKRVAIKVFHAKLSQEKINSYKTCIKRLENAGVRLPKIGFVKMSTARCPTGELVQVSHLFGSTKKGSKISNKAHAHFETKKARLEAVIEMTKVANAGYSPMDDLVEGFLRGPKGIIPIDLGSIVTYERTFGPSKMDSIVGNLASAIDVIGHGKDNKEYRELYNAAFKAALPEIKKALKNISPAFDKA